MRDNFLAESILFYAYAKRDFDKIFMYFFKICLSPHIIKYQRDQIVFNNIRVVDSLVPLSVFPEPF